MEYSAELGQRFRTPARAGRFDRQSGGVFEGAAEDRSLNVWVEFQVRLEDGVIEQVRFRAFGCPHTLAAADLIAEELEGKSVDELLRPDLEAVARRLGLPRDKFGKLLRIEDALAACHRQLSREERE